MLKSIVLNSPDTILPYIVLHDDELQPADALAIAEVYPHIIYRSIVKEPYRQFRRGDRGNYLVEKAYYILDAFKIEDFDRVITLDTDMIVRSSLSDLLEVQTAVGAVQAYFDNPTGEKLNSGLLVINAAGKGPKVFEELCKIGRNGNYELDKHDQGMLTAYLDGQYEHLDTKYNFVKRRIRDKPVPADVKIIHFTGPIKPWMGSEPGYQNAEAEWHGVDVPTEALWDKAVETAEGVDLDLYFYFYIRKLLAAPYDRENTVRFVAKAIQHTRLDLVESALSRDELEPGKRLDNILLYKGIVARAKGKMAEAEYCFNAALLTPTSLVPRLMTELADTHWLAGNYTEAREFVGKALAEEPSDRRVGKLYEKVRLCASLKDERDGAGDGDVLSHAAFYMTPGGNAGDYLVPVSVRWALNHKAPKMKWAPHHVHQTFDQAAIDSVNQTRAMVIGGGGLFIPDTAANLVSGWQWFVSNQALSAINVPIIIFAVGYNVFYGQDRFISEFDRNLRHLFDKAAFIGIRNHGSIRQLKARLPNHLHDKITYQPCPTTVMKQLRSDLFAGQPVAREGFVALNCAYDRKDARFGMDYQTFLTEMAQMISALQRETKVVYYSHTALDEQFLVDIARSHGIFLECRRLNNMGPDDVVDAYRRTSLAIGMRGHASMIPFGCGTPILSLISHPKMGYFLEDTQLQDWGVSIREPGFGEKAAEIASRILSDQSGSERRIDAAQDALWQITQANIAACASLIKPGLRLGRR